MRLSEYNSRWVLASGNKGKLKEIAWALRGKGVTLLPITELAPGFSPAETESTFVDNARLKAHAAFLATGLPSIADDSGLCVDGLGGEPGVQSARYAGEGKSDEERIAYLLDKMGPLEGDARRAHFECWCAAALPVAEEMFMPWKEEKYGLPRGWSWVVTTGRINGTIISRPRGSGGFGYDPVFVPDLYPDRTLAELEMSEKDRVSHRGLAFAALARNID